MDNNETINISYKRIYSFNVDSPINLPPEYYNFMIKIDITVENNNQKTITTTNTNNQFGMSLLSSYMYCYINTYNNKDIIDMIINELADIKKSTLFYRILTDNKSFVIYCKDEEDYKCTMKNLTILKLKK